MEEYPCYFSLSLSLTLPYSSVIYFSSFLLFPIFLSLPFISFRSTPLSFSLHLILLSLFVQFLLSLVLRPRRQSFFLVFPRFSGRFTVHRGRARTGQLGKRKRWDGKERNALWYTGHGNGGAAWRGRRVPRRGALQLSAVRMTLYWFLENIVI